MKRICQIAVGGMRGRKKDTAVLSIVILMSFLFLSVGTVLLSSLTESQCQQRLSLYGSWKLAYSNQDPVLSEMLQSSPWISRAHPVEILGADAGCGNVSVWDDDFAQMAGFRLLEGRTPEAPGEIVLEKGQLSLFDHDVTVGSKIPLELHYSGVLTPQSKDPNQPQTMDIFGVRVDGGLFYRMVAPDVQAEMVEAALAYFVENFDGIWSGAETDISDLPEFPMELPDSIEEMTQEQREELLTFMMSEPQLWWLVFGSSPKPLVPRTFGTVYHPSGTFGEVEWKLDSTYTLKTVSPRDSGEQCVRYGAVTDQKLALKRECTVVGILESTASHWDLTDASVPNSYISKETRRELQETVETLCQNSRPQQLSGDPETFLAQESYTLFETAASMTETYENLKKIPGNRLIPKYQEVLHNEGITLQDFMFTQQELEQEASNAPLGTQYSLEDVVSIFQAESEYYAIDYASEGGSTETAYFILPHMQIVMTDGSMQEHVCTSGFLFYPQNGQWERQKVLRDTIAYTDFAPEGFTSLGWLPDALEDAYGSNQQTVRINRYGYPAERGLSETMGNTLVFVIVTITVCAVFQIFFTQLRRRTRKLTLLRSVGATNGQILGILAVEGFTVTTVGLLLGSGLGVLSAFLILKAIPNTMFSMDWKLFFTGQFWGLIAVAIGMLLPSVRVIHAPLVERIAVSRRRHFKVKSLRRQSYPRICLRDMRTNPARTVGLLALCVFLLTMELCCVFLGTVAFKPYRESVLYADQPDFTLTMNHAGSPRRVEPMMGALSEMEGLARCDFYRRGQRLFLWYEGMENSPVVRAVAETDPRFLETTKADYPQKKEPALLTEFYGIEPDTDMFQRLLGAVTEGTLDWDAYAEGKQVLILAPMYISRQGGKQPRGENFAQSLHAADRMDFSLDPGAADLWQADTSIFPGMTVTLGTDSYSMREGNGNRPERYRQSLLEVSVGGVIRYFPDQGIWPLGGTVQSHVIIGSRKAMSRLYSDGFITATAEDQQYIDIAVNNLMPTEYGSGVWNLYAAEGVGIESTLSALSRYAKEENLKLHSFLYSKQTVYEKAFSSAVLVGTLALSTTVIVWMILFHTLSAAQEQSRMRTGILQALGITKRQFYGGQAAQAVGFWAVAVLLSHVLLLVLVFASEMLRQLGQDIHWIHAVLAALRVGFDGYPWLLHTALCLLELPVLLGFHLWAARLPMKHTPTENIRS